jgi:hypothetical protein
VRLTPAAPVFPNKNGPLPKGPFNLKFPTYLSIYSEISTDDWGYLMWVPTPALVVGRPEASAQTADGERLVAIVDIEPSAVAQVEDSGQHLGIGLLVRGNFRID